LFVELTWETKRRMVETLVERIEVQTVEQEGRSEAELRVEYCFDDPVVVNDHRDVRAVNTATRCTPAPASRRLSSPETDPSARFAVTRSLPPTASHLRTASTSTSTWKSFA
jgi:hypothetical protein